jgi:flagellar basal body-associated protein FliL
LKNLPLYIAIGVAAVLVVVGAAGVTAYFVIGRMNTTSIGSPGAAQSELKEGLVINLKPFVTNLADIDRARYINVTFELVARNVTEAKKLDANLPIVRDAIVTVLNTKKSMEVTGESGANKLKTDIQSKVNLMLGTGLVQKVLMTDFVVQ